MSIQIDTSWTLFLDRDGVINRRNFHGYIKNRQDFEFLEGVKEGLQSLSNKVGRIIVVTNQQGVGKGLMDEEQLDDIHQYMKEELARFGVTIHAVYSAVNLRGAVEDRRKPLNVMGLEAKHDFPEIDFHKSIMVGDTASDIQFGKNLGMKTVLIRSKEKVSENADIVVNNLIELANELEK